MGHGDGMCRFAPFCRAGNFGRGTSAFFDDGGGVSQDGIERIFILGAKDRKICFGVLTKKKS